MLFNKKNKINSSEFIKSRNEISHLLGQAFFVINNEQLKIITRSKSELSIQDIKLYEKIKKAHEELKTLYTEYEVLFNSTKNFQYEEEISIFKHNIDNIMKIIKVKDPLVKRSTKKKSTTSYFCCF